MSRLPATAAAVLAALLMAGLAAQEPAPPGAAAARPALPGALSTLRVAHPRLLVPDAEMPRIWAALAGDATLRRWRDRVRARAEAMLAAPVLAPGADGAGLLETSRQALTRITTLAGLFRLDGDRRWLARAVEELRAAASMPDWNPSHFLDTAQMTAAVAIGYDWLYADLSAADRSLLASAIRDKGVGPGLDQIERGALWAREPRTLWTEVCLGGLALGALAIAAESPAEAAGILDAARGEGMRRRLAAYAPDGGDRAGVGYWDDSTRFTVWLLSALDTALGTDLGLSAAGGLEGIGRFRMYAIGTSGAIFNYADARERPGAAPQMFWLAGRFDRPEYAAHERAWLRGPGADGPDIFHLLWSARVPAREPTAPPRAGRFDGVNLAFLRGDWRDPRASWVGLKGGDNAAGQAHLDLGSFVVDALGERWAIDLGAGDFALPGYFGDQRWTYLRPATRGHNTLVVDGANQPPSARAPLLAVGDDGYKAFAIVDVTEAYAPAVTRARRGVALIDGLDVLVQDELERARPVEVVWQMLTAAAVRVDQRRAVLTQRGKTMTLRVVAPAAATIETAAPAVTAPETPRPDVTVIRVRAPGDSGGLQVVVWLSTGDRPPPDVVALDQWPGH